ncbi:unnamed protein product [Heterobilharzia americana]|nr:unnamed protein product [Heterobilharzia americana]
MSTEYSTSHYSPTSVTNCISFISCDNHLCKPFRQPRTHLCLRHHLKQKDSYTSCLEVSDEKSILLIVQISMNQ